MIATTRTDIRRRGRLACLAVTALVSAIALCAAIASPAFGAVQWSAEVFQAPTNLEPGSVPPAGRGMVRIVVANVGDTTSTAWPSVSFQLPTGVTIGTPAPDSGWTCTGSPTVTCTNSLANNAIFGPIVGFRYLGAAGTSSFINLVVNVAPDAPEGVHPFTVTMSGGGDDSVEVREIRVSSDQPGFGPRSGTFAAGAFDQAGAEYTQAGGHPYRATGSFELNTAFFEPTLNDAASYRSAILSEGNPKDIVVDLPPGFVGDPTAGPKCATLGLVVNEECPPSTQVGVATLSPPINIVGRSRMQGVYNVVPPKDAPAQLAFRSPIGTVLLTPVLRSDGDLGLSVQVKNITQADSVLASSVTLWGVPADPSHDAQRCARPNFFAKACINRDEAAVSLPTGTLPPADADDPHPAGVEQKPFLTNPTSCTGDPVITTAHFSSWEDPGLFEPDGDPDLTDDGWVTIDDEAPAVTGCELLQFNPEIDVEPTSTTPGAPTGLDFELRVPQNETPNGVATAHLRDTTVVLPEGMTVNPSSANGLDACTSGQIGLTSIAPLRFTKLEPGCSLQSKIGTIEVHTPLLDESLTGEVFLARQSDNPFDSLLAIYFVVRGPGLLVKLAGHVQADPQTGRLTTTVLNNPQLPFDTLKVNLKSGPRAPLTNPSTCGPKTATAAFTSWAGHSVNVADSFAIDCPGDSGGFDPGFSAGSTNPTAGGFSPFVTRVTRDGGKELGRINVTVPRGLLASVKHVGVCTDAQIASHVTRPGVVAQGNPSCPLGSQIGTTTVGSGAGPTPFFPTLPGTNVSGRVFLSTPHKNSEFRVPGLPQIDYGVAIEVPAVAGPFDLGTVMVRAALYIDPETAQLTALSDRIPRILQGIPLNVRDARVNLDRPSFSTTPTSCNESRVLGDIRAQDGTTALRSSRYQVGDCAALNLSPRTSMRLLGRRQTRLGGNPALRVRVRQARGQSNLRTARAVLPSTLALDARNAGGDWLCDFEAGKRADCPKSSRIGKATAWSPLLKRPVSGSVFFVKNIRVDKKTGNSIRTLPTLLLKLDGEAPVHLRATSNVKRGRLVSTFANLPDASVSRFDMQIRGGAKRGILAVTGRRGNLCTGRQVTKLGIRGHNGKLFRQNVRMRTPCRRR